jgi:hypothetical protein
MKYYWLAINGESVAASELAVEPERVCCSPVPSQLLGFRTREEQLRARRLLLAAPAEHVEEWVARACADVRVGCIAVINPPNPEPPSKGPTVWMAG